MRFCVVKDFLIGACTDELFEDKTDAPVLGPCRQLAVRKGSCAAFSELDVAHGVQLSAGKIPLDGGTAALDVPSAFQDDGTLSRHCQHQRGKQSGRAAAHDNRTLRKGLRFFHTVNEGNGLRNVFQSAGENLFLHRGIFDLTFNGAYEVDVVLLAGVDGFFGQPDAFQL